MLSSDLDFIFQLGMGTYIEQSPVCQCRSGRWNRGWQTFRLEYFSVFA